MTKNNSLALFDFDGTITTGDTFVKFIRYCHSPLKFWFGIWLLSPIIILYKMGLIKNYKAKKMMFSYYFKGMLHATFIKLGEEFCKTKLPLLLKQEGVDKIKWHQQQGHRVVLVTASIKEWVAPWCNSIKIDFVSTEAEVIDQKITGNFSTLNCYGPEKVMRVKLLLNINEYSTIYAYGDTKGDREMLAIAQHPHYKPFNK